MSYSIYVAIEAVMKKAEVDLVDIEKQYQECLNKHTIPDNLLVDVKNCLSNMRSALDYLWCKVPNVKNGTHFPISNSEADFINKVAGIDKTFCDIVEKWQSHKSDTWLSNFGYIRNKNEHLTLVSQTRKETREFSIKKKDGGTFATFRGCVFSGNVSFGIGDKRIPIDEKTQFPAEVEDSSVDIERKIWVDFLFEGNSISPDFPKNISVLPFLKQSFENIKKIISDIENKI